MNYASIRTCDIANGEGVRVSLFVSGCTHHCKGCFNEEAQAFDYGEPFTREVEDSLLKAIEPSFISGLTLLGGEPMEPENQRVLVPFLRRFRSTFGDTKTLWVYTGCLYEDLCRSGKDSASPAEGAATTGDKKAASPAEGAATTGDAESLPLRNRVAGNSSPSYRWRTEVTDEFLAMTDVLVDGPFVEDLKDISLRFRGSSNQRILELKKQGTGIQ